MLGKLVKGLAEGVGEVVASPLTVANATTKALSREFDELLEGGDSCSSSTIVQSASQGGPSPRR